MPVKWKGKSRGTLLGYKIFMLFFRFSGLTGAYFLLVFVALYFLLFSPRDSRVVYAFYHKRMGYGMFKSIIATYKNFFAFGQVIIDKVAIFSGIKTVDFTYTFEGEHYLEDMIADGKGGMMISAHIGNIEVAGHFLKRLATKINVVRTDAEHTAIKDYLDSVTAAQKKNFILVGKNMSHIFEIDQALKNNELICLTGDRFLENTKALASSFMSESAYFPAGMFHLATRFRIPYSFVFAMKEGNHHYHFYATPAKINEGSIKDMIDEFSIALENMVRKYPEQWFNYYDFWAR